MINSVSLILHRNARDFFLLDSILVHVYPHLQRENPQQRSAEWSLQDLIKDAPERILRMRMQRRHLLFGNAETSIVHSRGNVPPSTDRREDPGSTSNVDALVGLAYPACPV